MDQHLGSSNAFRPHGSLRLVVTLLTLTYHFKGDENGIKLWKNFEHSKHFVSVVALPRQYYPVKLLSKKHYPHLCTL